MFKITKEWFKVYSSYQGHGTRKNLSKKM